MASRQRYDEEQVLRGLVSAWIQLRSQLTATPNACILAANFARRILPRFYVSTFVRPVGVIAFNREGWEAICYGQPLTGDAWSVGCSSRFTTSDFAYDGHVVIQTSNWYLDLTAEAFERPEHNIVMGGPVLIPLAKLGVIPKDHRLHELTQTTRTYSIPLNTGIYTFFDEPNNLKFRSAPDWQVDWHDLRGAEAEQIINDHLRSNQ
jgi:hypothetical protein